MQKEKKVRAYTRKTKSGKTVSVKAHTAKYDAAEEMRKALAKKAGAGDELVKTKEVVKEEVEDNGLGFTADEYKAWDHWDMVDDPKHAKALKVRKALIERMGRSAYKKYEDEMSDSYSARGHLKGFKGLGDLKSKKQSTDVAEPTVGTWQRAASGDTTAQDALLEQHFTKNVGRLTGEVTYSGKGKNDRWMTREEALKKLVPDMAAAHARAKEMLGKDAVVHYDQFGTKSIGKAVGKPFRFEEKGTGYTYDAQFVTDGRGRYGYVVRDAENPKGKFYVSTDEAMSLSELEPGVRKAAKAAGLTLRKGKWQRVEDSVPKTATPKKNGEPSPKSGSGMVTADGVKLRKTKAGKGVFLVGTDGRAYREVTKKDGTTSYKYSAEDTRYVQTDGGRKKLPPKKASTEESSTKRKAGVEGSKIPANYKITAKSLPKKNPKGTTVKMSATKRNGLFKYLPMQGWTLTDTVKSGSTTYGLFRKGDRSIAINTGKDKLYDDVVIQ